MPRARQLPEALDGFEVDRDARACHALLLAQELELAGQVDRPGRIDGLGRANLGDELLGAALELGARHVDVGVNDEHEMTDVVVGEVLEDVGPEEGAAQDARDHVGEEAEAVTLELADG